MKPTDNSSWGVPAFPKGKNDPAKAKGTTPAQTRLIGWMRQLERFALDDAAAAEKLMTHVAHGQALAGVDQYTTATVIAAGVFNDLIQHEAYDLFVEVFTACNKILKAHAEADGKPFKATLVLKLPLDWKPSKPEEMRAAFLRLEVQRVGMVGEWEYRTPAWEISVGACQCLATLLGNPSCQEVAIDGVVRDAAVVLEALKTSQVNSLDLPWRGSSYIHHDLDLDSEKALAPVVIDEAMCLRWKRLSIEQPRVLIHSSQAMTPEARWPELQSLSAPLLRGPSYVPAFLKIAARSPISPASHCLTAWIWVWRNSRASSWGRPDRKSSSHWKG
ncbi:hypothetical protein [Hydrogenophaga sp. BPS33]|uniref:hypothetical protein n=1 Tax=Hydrogenophaga sp. BPS33 TaxID=2651974 RepID=UPI00131FC6AF|nr:hypothetical protein [Hydrogenophaga sp. BPS33]QHE83973.1 hypothetical protein F9K07_03265 [Hydrogenophaga sp. BPS33]